MKFILATKEKMTRIFTADGLAHAGTILATDPVVVTQVKTKEGRDGYSAIQVGQGSRKVKNISNQSWVTPRARAMKPSASSALTILQRSALPSMRRYFLSAMWCESRD